MRIEKTNTSYTDRVKILKNAPVGFLVIESEHLKFKHEKKKKTKKENGLPKVWEQTKKAYWQ